MGKNRGRRVNGDVNAIILSSPVPFEYDYYTITRVSSGEAEGEIETIEYRTGGSGGTTVATTTLTYDADGEVETFTRT